MGRSSSDHSPGLSQELRMGGGGKQQASSSSSVFSIRYPRAASSIPMAKALAFFVVLAVSSLCFFFLPFASLSSRCSPDLNHGIPFEVPFPVARSSGLKISENTPPEYSFVASLEKFLASGPQAYGGAPDLSREGGGAASEEALDEAIWSRDAVNMYGGNPLGHWSALSMVRVYVYEMPAKFTYDLLRLFQSTYKETVNLTSNGSPVHRLIEQVTSVLSMVFLWR